MSGERIADFVKKNTDFKFAMNREVFVGGEDALYVKDIAELQPDSIYVINPGNHWVVMVMLTVMQTPVAVYFDPLGSNPHSPYGNVGNWSNNMFKRSSIPVIYKRDKFQKPSSAVCGEYVCLFLLGLDRIVKRMRTMKFDSVNDAVNWLADQNPVEDVVDGAIPGFDSSTRIENDRATLQTFKMI